MDLRLGGKTAVVTGASRGLGRAIALALAREGCNLVICARGARELEATAQEICELGAKVDTLVQDMAEPDAGDRVVGAAVDVFGAVDVLVNNVGGNIRKEFAEASDLVELNLMSHVRASRAAVPPMKAAGGGSILFISSIFGREAGGPGLVLYNTTKAALISVAKIMALELAPHGIRVNSVAPGSIRHPGGSWDERAKADPEGMAKFVADNIPIGRFGTAEELADVVTFLASERASLVTGACINVDGGQSRSLI
jgi:3-oxoacyl-[acyl-carrier protein] reductase